MFRLAFVAVAALAATGATLPDSSVKWDGIFHVRVHCDGSTSCTGNLTIRAPDADPSRPFAGIDYSVAASTTKTLDLDPAGSDNRTIDALSSVVVRVQPTGADAFEATKRLDKSSAPSPPAPKPLGPPTKSQHVSDQRGDAHGAFGGMDLIFASATRDTRTVVFKVRTVVPPPNQHDSFGNPTAPCLEIARTSGHALQTCGDARLRGYTRTYWPKVRFGISGATSRWVVPLGYLPKREFRWRAYVGSARHPDRNADTAPNRGYLTFIR